MPKLGFSNSLSSPRAISKFSNKYSIVFDGTNDVVIASNAITNYPFTMSAWVKSVTDEPCRAMYMTDASQNGRYFGINIAINNKVYLQASNTSNKNNYSDASFDNQWVHIVGVFTNTTTRALYINGSANTDNVNTDSVTFTPSGFGGPTMDTISFGAEYDGSAAYGSGRISDAAIWNVALDANDISTIYNGGKPLNLNKASSYNTDRTSNLRGWWRMGDGKEKATGTTAFDMNTASGANNGTLTNGPTFAEDAP